MKGRRLTLDIIDNARLRWQFHNPKQWAKHEEKYMWIAHLRLHGKTYPQIAQEVGVSTNMAKVIVHRFVRVGSGPFTKLPPYSDGTPLTLVEMSVRACNAFRNMCHYENFQFPTKTVGDLRANKEVFFAKLNQQPNCGAKTYAELHRLILGEDA